jgi:Domain of unknown function (DUF4331)
MKPKAFTSVLALVLALILVPPGLFAANHREAPITALDRTADIADFFAFVSYNDPNKVTFILDVDPLLEPANGPNYFPFDPDILYEIKVDNNFDAKPDVTIQFRFETEVRGPGVFTGFVGAGNGLAAPANGPNPKSTGLVVPPAITALDGAGSEGLLLRQRYSVTMVRNGNTTLLSSGRRLFAVPTNVGPRTMPNYSGLFQQGLYDLAGGAKVFAGTVDDPFWIDLGAAFDSLNFRASAFDTGVAGVLSDAQDATDNQNFAPDDVSGYNVNAIAIEVPITWLTRDGMKHAANNPLATIGAWGTTSRPQITVRRSPNAAFQTPTFRQVQRMGNPLINELIIGTGSKDRFSMDQPGNDGQFAKFFLDPVLARVLNAVFGINVPDAPRADLLPLVTYAPPIAAPGTPSGPVADLLRLNTGVAATPAANRRRLGLLAGDAAGFPNGRRVSDDVTDISTRAVAGVLAGGKFAAFPNNRLADGVNTNDVPYQDVFPYVGLAQSGRDSRHSDPGEPGCGSLCPVN